MAFACSEESVQPDKIIYQNLGNTFADYNNPFRLDANNDGQDDFIFSTSLLSDGNGTHLQFTFYPAFANHAYVSNESAVVLAKAFPITPALPYTKRNEPLATKTINSTTTSWHGDWVNANKQYLGIRIKSSGNDLDFHYGWICISFDKQNERILIHDFAYQTQVNTEIKAGDL